MFGLLFGYQKELLMQNMKLFFNHNFLLSEYEKIEQGILNTSEIFKNVTIIGKGTNF